MYCRNEECSGEGCTEVEYIETDSRQEWCEEIYKCPDCGTVHVDRKDFDQNGMVISHTFLMDGEEKPDDDPRNAVGVFISCNQLFLNLKRIIRKVLSKGFEDDTGYLATLDEELNCAQTISELMYIRERMGEETNPEAWVQTIEMFVQASTGHDFSMDKKLIERMYEQHWQMEPLSEIKEDK